MQVMQDVLFAVLTLKYRLSFFFFSWFPLSKTKYADFVLFCLVSYKD